MPMTDLWQLPMKLEVAGESLPIHPDFRDILQIIAVLDRESLPAEGRLYVAMRLFYPGFPELDRSRHGAAARAMLDFIGGGREEAETSGPRLLDWQQDADLILPDINKVAGQEIRALRFVHWWTFLGWFGAIGEGRLSAVVGIRRKLAAGSRLEDWEREYYRQNRSRIELKRPCTAQEQAEKQRLLRLLEGGREGNT